MRYIDENSLDTAYLNYMISHLREKEKGENKKFSSFLPLEELSDRENVIRSIKKAILLTDGNPFLDPDNLTDETKMEIFAFNPMQNMRLAQRLNEILESVKPGADRISTDDVANCETVKDCIELILS